jgi:steroid 5-alpha reductase family enzyme
MTPLPSTLLLNLSITLSGMLVLWTISLSLRNASIVDPFWGMGFVVIAWSSSFWNHSNDFRTLLLTMLTTAWGLRLSLFLMWRNWGHGEDRRYKAMRTYHDKHFWWVSLFSVFLLQGILLWFISMPLQIVALNRISGEDFSTLDILGIILWSIGITFETVGDWQLAKFNANPANENLVMDRGLWRYTRHPNYFGDFCVWWGIYFIAIDGGALWTIASPILMSILLIKISGVTLLESTITERRPDYIEYQRKTSPFFPWPGKKS